MALSQVQCLDDNHVNWRTNESKPDFLYSEDQRLAIETLIQDGRDAFEEYIKTHNLRSFLSDLDVDCLTENVEVYAPGRETPVKEDDDATLSLQYWPELTDRSLPELDMGWPDCVSYRGVTRVNVYTQPPIEGQTHIKEVVRKIIGQAQKVIGIVMDLFTDVDIFKDLIDAGFKKKVAVYIIVETTSVPHFLSMCQRAAMHPGHLKTLRVCCTGGTQFHTRSSRKVDGRMAQKFMFVDGDKAVCGSYSFTWTASRLDRNLITVVTGQGVETFDRLFRELYSTSRSINLGSVAMEKEPEPEPVTPPTPAAPPSADVARKLINPKYALVTMPTSSPVENTPRIERNSSPNPMVIPPKRTKELLEAPPLHPGLLHLEKVNMIPYLPTWPEPDPPSDVIGFINIRDSSRPLQTHLMRSEQFETSKAIRFKEPFTLPPQVLPETACLRSKNPPKMDETQAQREGQSHTPQTPPLYPPDTPQPPPLHPPVNQGGLLENLSLTQTKQNQTKVQPQTSPEDGVPLLPSPKPRTVHLVLRQPSGEDSPWVSMEGRPEGDSTLRAQHTSTSDSPTATTQNPLTTHTPSTEAHTPSTNTHTQSIDTHTRSPDAQTQSPNAHTQSPDAQTQSPDTHTQSPDAHTQSPDKRAKDSEPELIPQLSSNNTSSLDCDSTHTHHIQPLHEPISTKTNTVNAVTANNTVNTVPTPTTFTSFTTVTKPNTFCTPNMVNTSFIGTSDPTPNTVSLHKALHTLIELPHPGPDPQKALRRVTPDPDRNIPSLEDESVGTEPSPQGDSTVSDEYYDCHDSVESELMLNGMANGRYASSSDRDAMTTSIYQLSRLEQEKEEASNKLLEMIPRSNKAVAAQSAKDSSVLAQPSDGPDTQPKPDRQADSQPSREEGGLKQEKKKLMKTRSQEEDQKRPPLRPPQKHGGGQAKAANGSRMDRIAQGGAGRHSPLISIKSLDRSSWTGKPTQTHNQSLKQASSNPLSQGPIPLFSQGPTAPPSQPPLQGTSFSRLSRLRSLTEKIASPPSGLQKKPPLAHKRAGEGLH